MKGIAEFLWTVYLLSTIGSNFCQRTHNRVYEWNKEQEVAFQILKKRLSTAPMLAYPVPGSAFILDTDDSGVAVGGVLSQVIDGHEKGIVRHLESQREIIV